MIENVIAQRKPKICESNVYISDNSGRVTTVSYISGKSHSIRMIWYLYQIFSFTIL